MGVPHLTAVSVLSLQLSHHPTRAARSLPSLDLRFPWSTAPKGATRHEKLGTGAAAAHTEPSPPAERGAGASMGPNLVVKVLEYNNIYKTKIEVLEK